VEKWVDPTCDFVDKSWINDCKYKILSYNRKRLVSEMKLRIHQEVQRNIQNWLA